MLSAITYGTKTSTQTLNIENKLASGHSIQKQENSESKYNHYIIEKKYGDELSMSFK